MGALAGKIAIVTGGESGIGRGIALAFAREGADVVIAGLNRQKGSAVVRDIESLGRKGLFVTTDVTDSGQVSGMVGETLKQFKKIDILVNNAGVQKVGSILDLTEDDWDKVVDTNLKGTFLCTKAVLGGMIENKWGRIVNVSSVHGKIASAFKAPYVAAKHGVLGLTKVTALETAPQGITANAICPGYVDTELVRMQIPDQAKTHGMTEEEVTEKVFLSEVPQKRFISVEEVAALAVFLASDPARGITGEAFGIDGGWAAH